MSQCTTPDLMRHAAHVQLGLVVAVLLGSLLIPRPGSAVLLVPLFKGSIERFEAGRIAVLHAGWIRGSVLVRVEGRVPVMELLRSGVLPLAAPGFSCGSTDSSLTKIHKAV